MSVSTHQSIPESCVNTSSHAALAESSTAQPSPSPDSICPLLNERAFDCPICLDLLVEPVTLQCGHTYCEHCISQWIVSHTQSKSRKKGMCRCPSCKAVIHQKFTQSISFTLRDFLKNQFTHAYQSRYNNTHQSRMKYNAKLMKLKKLRAEEVMELKRCCGIIRVKKWVMFNVQLLINPNLHRNAQSWLVRWLVLYGIIIMALLPFILPIITGLMRRWFNATAASANNRIHFYFLDDIFKISTNTISFFGPLIQLFHAMLQYFGVIVPIRFNTGFLSDQYIKNAMMPYDTLPNIYTSHSTDLYYRKLFRNWKSADLKQFMNVYGIDSSCFERQCFADIIVSDLKRSQYTQLINDPLPISLLQQYLSHYNVKYNECYNGWLIWSKDYECFVKKAASVKVMNDIYFNKDYLLSQTAKEEQMKYRTHEQTRNSNQGSQHRQSKKSNVFGFDDIGNIAFNILSGGRYF